MALGRDAPDPTCARQGAAGCAGDPCGAARPLCDPVGNVCVVDRLPLHARRGPCTRDEECQARIHPCECGCRAMLASSPVPSDQEWRTMCNGGPPGNCGPQSPCVGYGARCEPTTHECVLVAAPRGG